jgi:hypothetical protein
MFTFRHGDHQLASDMCGGTISADVRLLRPHCLTLSWQQRSVALVVSDWRGSEQGASKMGLAVGHSVVRALPMCG